MERKVCWNVTNRCNICCKHCFRNLKENELCPFRTNDHNKINNLSITLEQFKDVVNKYKDIDIKTTFNNRKDMENQLVVSPAGNLIMSRKNIDIVLIDNMSE